MIEIITLLIVYFFNINFIILIVFLFVRWTASGMLSFKRYILDTDIFKECFYNSSEGVYIGVDFKKGVKIAKKRVILYFVTEHTLTFFIYLINSFLLAYAFLHKNYYIDFSSIFKMGMTFFITIIFSEFLGYIISMRSSILDKKKEYQKSCL